MRREPRDQYVLPLNEFQWPLNELPDDSDVNFRKFTARWFFQTRCSDHPEPPRLAQGDAHVLHRGGQQGRPGPGDPNQAAHQGVKNKGSNGFAFCRRKRVAIKGNKVAT